MVIVSFVAHKHLFFANLMEPHISKFIIRFRLRKVAMIQLKIQLLYALIAIGECITANYILDFV